MRVTGSVALTTLLLGSSCLLACSSPQTRQGRALMVAPIAPASDALFNAVIYTNGQLAASPKTDAEWNRLQQHANSLVTAAASLRDLAPAEDPGQWVRQSEALGNAAAAALAAVAARNLDGLLAAGSQLYDTCTTCHTTYVKDP